MQPDEMDGDIGWCICGGAWFALAIPDEAEGTECGPAVCINEDGNITGYAGKLVCIECGNDWKPGIRVKRTRRHLRLLEVDDGDG